MARKANDGVIYVGGGLIIPGLPPRDLTHNEVMARGGYEFVVQTGLYEYAPKSKGKRRRTNSDPKEVNNGND